METKHESYCASIDLTPVLIFVWILSIFGSIMFVYNQVLSHKHKKLQVTVAITSQPKQSLRGFFVQQANSAIKIKQEITN